MKSEAKKPEDVARGKQRSKKIAEKVKKRNEDKGNRNGNQKKQNKTGKAAKRGNIEAGGNCIGEARKQRTRKRRMKLRS